MPRFRIGTKIDWVFGAPAGSARRAARRFRPGSLPWVEILEGRVLLANITPSGVISAKPDGSNFDYTIKLTNSSTSAASIGTFWYAWVPGEDFLATNPISVAPPTGWTDNITNGGTGDGYAIQYISSGPSYNVQPGSSLNFAFTSADTPASVNGDSKFYPGTPVGTSYVYPMGPFSDAGHMFVVTPALTSIAVTPANPSVAKGLTEQFTATGTYSDESTKNLTSQVTWASATPSVATITSAGLATAAGTGMSSISATLSGITGTTVLSVTAALLQSIAVTPANPSVSEGTTQQFKATGTYTDKTTQDLTSQVTWASATTSVATISSTGLATGASPGTSTISATLAGITGTTVLTVSNATLQSIAVTPANPSVANGLTEQFTATGTYSDESTKNLTSQVTWASATPSVATITSAGLTTAAGTGTSSISATLSGITGTTVLTVTAAVLQSIGVTPANPSVAKGLTEQFTATGTYTDRSTKDLTSQVTWASATSAVATITSAGLATAARTGTSSISATLTGVTGTTVLTVTAAALQSIAVTPANPSVAKGLTEQFTATGTYTDNSTQNLTSQVTWASATPSVATVTSGGGLATGAGTGTSTISATLSGITGSTVLTVTAAVLQSIAVTPSKPSVPDGDTATFTATGSYSDKSTQDLTSQVTWASSNSSVAIITTAGVATAVADGTSSISATLNGISGSTTLTVTAALQSIDVTPADPSVPKGETEQFVATGHLSDGSTEDLTSQVTWASGNGVVATISNAIGSNSLASALTTGTSNISATVFGITGSTVLTVSPAALQSIAVTPVNPGLAKGKTEQFTATGTYSDKSTQNLTNQVTWASASTSAATITSTGLATWVSKGTTTISATLGAVSGSTVLTALAPPVLPLVTIRNVRLVFNTRHMVTQILVTFSGAVNATEAQRAGTYRLATAGKGGSFTAKNAMVIKLRSATYMGATDKVTLTPKKPFGLSKAVQLLIEGTPPSGLQDSLGRFIDGADNGRSGTNGVVVLTKGGVTLSQLRQWA